MQKNGREGQLHIKRVRVCGWSRFMASGRGNESNRAKIKYDKNPRQFEPGSSTDSLPYRRVKSPG